MKHIASYLVLVLCIGLMSCKDEKKETEEITTEIEEIVTEEVTKKSISITLSPRSESNVQGKVMFTEENGEVSMTAKITGLSEGMHAIHIHESSDCSAADGTSAGGHWNPTAQPHGKWGAEEGFHKGDIGNFEVKADGNGEISMTTDEWCIGCDDPNNNIMGKSIIVHQGEDDFTSQPSGAAGGRVSCGGIIE
ncbi:MAG: superoxide dismutase family protein [Winogradskyella sp.]|nr:superoxide dismutase family protein [Winogradskyella sp.]